MSKNQSDSILLVDDDSELILSLSRNLKDLLPHITIHGAGAADKALTLQATYKIRLAVVDLEIDRKKGPDSGFELISALLLNDPQIRIIVLTGHSSIEFGIEALKRGAVSFQEKPSSASDLSVLIKDFLQQRFLVESASKIEQARAESVLDLLTSNTLSDRIKNEILFAASMNQSIFISGESGVGKSLCASLIHKVSSRAKQKFVRYQPSFVSADLVNSDLFGHIKGSFTGADQDRKGLLLEAHGGTLFIDEIDALPAETQVLLLGVLQEKKFRPVGSDKELEVDFRLITASNTSIKKAIQENKIRKDFYFRVAHHTLTIPPLRERVLEIESLINQFLKLGNERKDFSVCRVSSEGTTLLKNHDWPGNIRELQAVVEGAAFRAQFHNRFEILPEDIHLKIDTFLDKDDSVENGFHDRVLLFKKKIIREALERSGGNQVKAAKELGLDRSSMRRIIADEL